MMIKDINIPDNWCLPELGDVLDVQGGSQPPKSNFIYEPKEGYIRLLQIRDFGEKPVPTYVPIKKVTKFCELEDVLIARYGASLGRIVTGMYGAYNVALAKVINDNKVFSTRYLFYLLQTQILQTPLAMLSRSAQNGFAKHEIAHIKIPLPPLPEQHRIVAKIEELFSELDKGIETLKTAKQQLKVYRQAVLKYAFEGRLTNPDVKDGELPEGWEMVSIEKIVSNQRNALKAGPFGSSLKKEFYVSSGYKIYGQEQVISGNPYFGNYFIDKDKFEELSSCSVQPNDILISLVGTVGKVLLLPKDAMPGIINPRLIKISLNKEKYLPLFFKYYFESAVVKSHYSSKAQGTTMDVLNLGIIKTIPFPLLSLEEQNIIVQEIESRLSVCDKIEESIEQGLQQAEALRQSILKKAFEGKLVPQDSNDEPASVLLERIKAERGNEKPEKKSKFKKTS